MQDHNKYLQRGVSSDKTEVYRAIKALNKGIFQNTFCKIIDNPFDKDSETAFIMHADGAGTKSSLAYVYWKETNNLNVWKNIAQDAIVMNLDDILCTAYSDNFMLSSSIGRNKNLITGEVIEAIISGTADFCNNMKNYNINIEYAGGETADVGDIVRTIIVDSTMSAQIQKKQVIQIDIHEDDVILGLSSSGKAIYENEYNSGIGSNGLTMARHELFNKQVAEKYPESFDNQLNKDIVYTGKHLVTDKVEVEYTTSHKKTIKEIIDIGKLALSPTRTYAPILVHILKGFYKDIHGIIHCTGGGQTKVLHFLNKPLRILKNNMFPLPPLFQLIAKENANNMKELYKVFNMGHRMEIYTTEHAAMKMIEVAKQFNVDAQIIGRVEKSKEPQVLIQDEYGEFMYTKNEAM